MTSLSTRFLGQPRLTKPTFKGEDSLQSNKRGRSAAEEERRCCHARNAKAGTKSVKAAGSGVEVKSFIPDSDTME